MSTDKVIYISKLIEAKIKALDELMAKLEESANEKATALADYEKEIAKKIIALRNGEQFEIDGNIIDATPITLAEKVARGICWKECLLRDQAESQYKNIIKQLDVICAQLNGYQSINRYLSEMPE